MFIVSALVGATAGVIWLSTRGSGDPRSDTPYIVLISIDTCRPDRLSCYGFFRPTTPNLDALAREGFRFQNVIAPAAMTLPAHASMLTGTIPPYHGVHANGTYRLRESDVTLAEILRDGGYVTAAVVGSFVLDARFGLAQGFDVYDDRLEIEPGQMHALNARPAEEVTRAAREWLHRPREDKDEPFFLFLHYYDPHFPYRPPEPFASLYQQMPYAGEIAYVDQQIGEFVSELKKVGVYDRALIIVTADHGEARGEHGEQTHGYFMYHSTTKVPLIVKLPGRRDGRAIGKKVALIDIVPTILDHLDLAAGEQMQGESFLPLLADQVVQPQVPQATERFIYSEALIGTQFGCSPLIGVETDDWKYIHTTKPELYHLSNDPQEEVNLLKIDPRRAGEMRTRLEEMLETHRRRGGSEAALALDARARERIAALGYVETERAASLDAGAGKEDPKDFLPYFIRLNIANALITQASNDTVVIPRPDGSELRGPRMEVAVKLCTELVEERPDLADPHLILGMIAEREGRLDAAAAHYERGIAIAPHRAKLNQGLGNVLAQQGRWEEALKWLQKAVELARDGTGGADAHLPGDSLDGASRADPLLVDAGLAVAKVLTSLDRHDEAAATYRDLLALHPLTVGAQGWPEIKARILHQLGSTLVTLGRTDEAAEAFQQALHLDPEHREAREALAGLRGNKAGARSP